MDDDVAQHMSTMAFNEGEVMDVSLMNSSPMDSNTNVVLLMISIKESSKGIDDDDDFSREPMTKRANI